METDSVFWGVSRPTAHRPGLADWQVVAQSARSLARVLLADRPPAAPPDGPLPVRHRSPADGDRPDDCLVIGQSPCLATNRMDLAEYEPVRQGAVSTAPSNPQSSADRPLGVDLGNADVHAIDLAFEMLDRELFEMIAFKTNAHARRRRDTEPLLHDWEGH
ncbi:uncharacterized protein LOC119111438 [Pollicipes pollicipes]|uniref:uncharacterized protein LOC119111438 n=1 Tax=Pollicipes pollicipes TaxID=41117 RepID=UPI001885545B|nr:uncharacterized protein LOC119111438 [Pollicipes pollicipes]